MSKRTPMDLYEIEVSGKVTIDFCESFAVQAESKEEAIEEAKKAFLSALEEHFSVVYDCKDIEIGYTGILKYHS